MTQASCAGYPREVCGIVLGRPQDQGSDFHRVARVEILSNILEAQHAARLESLVQAGLIALPKERLERSGAFEFAIDPQEHCQKILKAEREGLDQIGVFHSHPDHPAVPSATDAAQPFLSGWSNLIVSIHDGKFKAARSWYRKSEGDPFQEQKIFIE